MVILTGVRSSLVVVLICISLIMSDDEHLFMCHWPSGRLSGGGNDNPLQYSCQENSMDRGAHGVTKSWTRLGDWAHIHVGRLYIVTTFSVSWFPFKDSCDSIGSIWIIQDNLPSLIISGDWDTNYLTVIIWLPQGPRLTPVWSFARGLKRKGPEKKKRKVQ